MANVHPYLALNNTKEALEYYKKVLGATDIHRVPVSAEAAMKAAHDFWDHLHEVTINMPFEEQFWDGAMGDFTDAYGIRWLLHAQPYSKMKQMLNQ